MRKRMVFLGVITILSLVFLTDCFAGLIKDPKKANARAGNRRVRGVRALTPKPAQTTPAKATTAPTTTQTPTPMTDTKKGY